MGLLGTLFSFSGHINRRRFFWVSTIVGIPGMLLFVLFLAAFVGFENIQDMQAGDATTTKLAIVILLHGGGMSYISAALIFKRIRDAGHIEAFSWVYAVLLVLSIMMTVDQARLGHFGGDASGIIGLILAGISFFALFAKSSPHNQTLATSPAKNTGPGNGNHDDSSADAIIARAVEERRLTQQTQQVTRPALTRSSGPATFGNRAKPGFGTR